MKKLFLICMVMFVFGLQTNAQEDNFEDYVYPFGFRTFNSLNSEGKTICISQFSFTSQSYNNFLVEEVYIGLGQMSAKTSYRYHVDGNAVISDVQLRQNALTGSTKFQDKITLFAFPNNETPYTWAETKQGEKYNCKSEYVYINASIDHNMLFRKAIKITRDNSYNIGNEKHRIIETSYWVRDFGRIITYEDWDGTKRASSKLDVLDFIQEITKEVYDSHINK